MSKILLGVTGSVAATVTKKMVPALVTYGHDVRIVATRTSFYFWNREDVDVPIFSEEEEWPGVAYVKDQPVAHIFLRDWADVLLIAPLTANTLGKMAQGQCDNLLTSIVRAWFLYKPLIVAPAMNTQMWLHPLTAQHLGILAQWYNMHTVYPVEKMLACGDVGVGAMADIATIVGCINEVTQIT